MTFHYRPASTPPGTVCGLPYSPRLLMTAALDAVDCGNCLSSRRWRMDMSQRNYKREYERFYGPGGFLDRAGQTSPASATTAPQARAALERRAGEEFRRVAGLVMHGAGDAIVAVAIREAVGRVMADADMCMRHTAEAALSAAAEGQVPGDRN